MFISLTFKEFQTEIFSWGNGVDIIFLLSVSSQIILNFLTISGQIANES